MQIAKEDKELKPYIITISELAKLLNVPKSNIYRDIDSITDDILNNPVYVREETCNSGNKKSTMDKNAVGDTLRISFRCWDCP